MEASTWLILDVFQTLLRVNVRTGFVGIFRANISLLSSIMYVPEWKWSSLPPSYLESAYLSMDADDAVHTYFQPNDTTFDSLNHEPSPELEGDGSCDTPENPPSKK